MACFLNRSSASSAAHRHGDGCRCHPPSDSHHLQLLRGVLPLRAFLGMYKRSLPLSVGGYQGAVLVLAQALHYSPAFEL